ncbi:gluconolactonase [Brachybacterium endophyticum]|uniref:Gluconolactonase n=1 Tax=Brachybacterium endophyticum TaxID=2182385 RepID=A0A2U2RKB9_9MICO|nr:SMP-30/gluconolactonase/LRE family protein [Brachybacterium endophyticum]PWH06281.1 gluconolactonase [Brachybacterium endophyticum]
MDAVRLTDSLCYHAEGPIWSESWGDGGALRWVDMLAGDYLELDPASGGITRTATGSPVVACVRPRRGGGAVLALEKGFGLQDPDGSITPLATLWDGPVRMNEGTTAPDGTFWCGSMAYDQATGAARMWRLGTDGEATAVWDDLTISNGLVFSPDHSRAYYVDTPTERVDVLDWDEQAGLMDRRPFADLHKEDGHPDGLTIDTEGRVWVAMNGAGRVLGLDDGGAVAERIEVGARQVTACTFGGQDRATLYITTSRENLAPDDDPAAGSLFAVEPGARGLADELVFGG